MDFALPEIGEGVYEAELVRWLVKPGDMVKRGQNLLEVMTDKATMEIPSPFAGTITSVNGEAGQSIKVGQVILEYTPASNASIPESKPATVSVPAVQQAFTTNNGVTLPATPLSVRAAPSVRQMARKLGVDLTTIHGSGPDGRVIVEDLTQLLRQRGGQEVPAARPAPAPDFGKPGTRIPLHGLRRRIAEHMVLAKKTIPHYGYVDECDVTDLVRLRTSLKEAYLQAGVKLTYLPFFVKAVVAALKEVPLVNASLEEEAKEIVLHDRYHVGIAVATPGGLIVPVVHDADRKDIGMLAREIDRLSVDARAGRSRREDLRGGTFTLTSVGNIGGLFSTPVINHPEVGILGIGKIARRPVYDESGAIRPADLVYLSMSFDHRVVDGAVGAAFTNAIIKHLSNPALLLVPEKL